ncbi:MAG: hypothetical protein PWP62_419 [Eubacteriaceae bacterium]|nr:hypothetical protein [Eubacteriaceae bacterium]MDK2961403.1 hypothetical protein [Eubacteriaceae bacterium]
MNKEANHYLGEAPIGKLMMKFSIPCIVSLLVSALYNIVDQIFIGHGVGYLGNGATNVVFPITIIALAIALLIGDGGAAFLSICQGKNDRESAHKSVGNALVLFIGSGILLTILFVVFKNQILWGFGATENNIAYAMEYFDYLVIGIPFSMFGNGLNSLIRADGSPQFAMLSIFSGCIINVILDPIAIFGLGMGMKGAALATIAGQIISALIGASYLFRTRSFKFKKESFVPDAAILKQILPLGISSFLTQMSIVIVMGVMNNIIVQYGALSRFGADIPLTVIGIVMKVFQIVIAFVVGVAAGSQPIVGYNYGAGNNDRVIKIYKTMMLAEIAIGLVAMILFEFFPLQIIAAFGSESALYNEFAVMAFRIYLSTIVICCIQKSTSIFLQSLGKPFMSTGLSLLRDFILSVPLIIILPRFFGLEGVLYSAPIADVLSMVGVVIMMLIVIKELRAQPMKLQTQER